MTNRCPVCGQPYRYRGRTRRLQDVTLGTMYRHRHGAYTYLHAISSGRVGVEG